MIFLFASTSRSFFLQNIIDILALPNSAIYRLVYNQRFVSEELMQSPAQTYKQYIKYLKKLEGHEALIILMDQSKLNKDGIQFYPVRRAKIKYFDPDFDVFRVYVEVGEYVDLWETNVKDYDAWIKKAADEVQRQMGKYLIIDSGIQASHISFATHESTPRVWRSIVDIVNEGVYHNEVFFYRIIGLREVKVPIYRMGARIRRILPDQSGYVLVRGKIYRLDLSLYKPDPLKGVWSGSKIVPIVDKSHFAYQPNEIDIHFNYDKQSIELVTIPANMDSYTKIKLSFQEPVHKKSSTTVQHES